MSARADPCHGCDYNGIKAAGGRASLLMLPDAGIQGNNRMLKMRMLMDKNNPRLADLLLKWIDENGGK